VTQLALTLESPRAAAPAKFRAGNYTCTHCWSDYGLTDSLEHAYCRTCGRRDRLRPQVPGEVHGLPARCPSPPEGYLRCTDELAATCPVCSVQAGFAAGADARWRSDEADRRAQQDAMPYVDFVRSGSDARTRSLVRLWDEDGYEAGWRRLAACGDGDADCYDDMRREFRRYPLPYARVLAGELAPIPEGAP
jgi:DNA-directed RNA polymerase subunit RPC12/RpoP